MKDRAAARRSVATVAFLLLFLFTVGWEGYRFWTPRDVEGDIREVGRIGQDTYALYLEGTHAYISQAAQILVVDVASPKNPRIVAQSTGRQGIISRLLAQPPYIYTVSREDALRVLEVREGEVENVAHLDLPAWGEDVVAREGKLYVANAWEGLAVVDATTPTSPRLLSSYPVSRYAYGLALAYPYAFVAGWDTGLWVVDVRDPQHPALVGHYDTPGRASRVVVSGGMAYVADGGGVEVVDVSDPTHPVHVARYTTPGWTFGLSVAGPYLAVACGGQGIYVFDVRHPRRARLIGSYDTPGAGNDVVFKPPYLFVADGRPGLLILEFRETGERPQ